MDPAPFVRGAAFPATKSVPYPRAKPDNRLPRDTWGMACVPAGVRVELFGAGDVKVETEGVGDDQDLTWVEVGERVIGYLPLVAGARIASISGAIEPAPAQPRWIAYGDSITEGWVTSTPAQAWPAVAGREHGLDAINMGYAGAARGEIVSAEHVAELPADVITIAHGTNCWTAVPHSAAMVAEGLRAFLSVVRQGHPETPIVVVSPIVRPDAETTPNRLGATLQDLRRAIEDVASERNDVDLVPGRDLVTAEQLPDGIHPGDEGHAAIAAAVGPVVAKGVG
jgi:lysophospholipase L1-like esterase